jgi:hypothetical protein
MPEPQVLVTLGVDTHADTHVAAALDQLGRHLGTITVATITRGFHELVEWALQFGPGSRPINHSTNSGAGRGPVAPLRSAGAGAGADQPRMCSHLAMARA